jgi:hypothetical protein
MKIRVTAVIILSVLCFVSRGVMSADKATDPGSVMIGGGLSFSSFSDDRYQDKINTLILEPDVMVFLVPGFSVGVELSFNRLSQGDYSLTAHKYLGKVQYIAALEYSIRPYVQAGFGFIRSSVDSDYGHSENGWTAKGGIGIYAFLNEHYAIRSGFDLEHDNWNISEGESQNANTFSVTLGFEGFIF